MRKSLARSDVNNAVIGFRVMFFGSGVLGVELTAKIAGVEMCFKSAGIRRCKSPEISKYGAAACFNLV